MNRSRVNCPAMLLLHTLSSEVMVTIDFKMSSRQSDWNFLAMSYEHVVNCAAVQLAD